ncbi:JAB domain-containing protein [Limisalsivibrio acetivorans]|uniref:JAB domain-containing protein n=1 Tax=Limisalsivibrio acetivorans TaxID=1304888 RepID=UPI0003B7AACD|nr:DNA repair protein RadC [Limisalsivibrio acetivorans]
MENHYKGHRQRLREKFLKNPSGMFDYEIIELLLGYVIPRRDVKPLAKDMVQYAEGLSGLLKTDYKEIDGAGPEVQRFFAIIREFIFRIEYETAREERLALENAEDVYRFLRYLIGMSEKENFITIFLDRNKKLLGHENISRGTVDRTAVFPREVAEASLKYRASFVIIAHNHPSGSLTPSKEDIDITSRVQMALETLDIALLDHIIVTEEAYLSLRQHDLI